MGGAEGTKLDLDFMDMERKTDVTNELVEEIQVKTKEFLQPNPTARAKMAAVKGISKLSGQAKSNTYPQPEGLLADCMLMYGKKLGDNSIFGRCLPSHPFPPSGRENESIQMQFSSQNPSIPRKFIVPMLSLFSHRTAEALVEMGESLRQMADVKYSLDDNIKQNFLEPLHHLQTKDLKEVMVSVCVPTGKLWQRHSIFSFISLYFRFTGCLISLCVISFQFSLSIFSIAASSQKITRSASGLRLQAT